MWKPRMMDHLLSVLKQSLCWAVDGDYVSDVCSVLNVVNIRLT